MKTRTVVWVVVAIVAVFCLKFIFRMYGIDLCWLSLSSLFELETLVRQLCVIIVHLALGFFIWRDAKSKRSELLIGVPPWVWALVGLATGVVGLILYWFANCSRIVRDQTLGAERDEPMT